MTRRAEVTPPEEPVPVTPAGLKNLAAEYGDVVNVTRPQLAERRVSAGEFGDLVENPEYLAAKEEQAWVEGRIATLKTVLRNAEVIPTRRRKN